MFELGPLAACAQTSASSLLIIACRQDRILGPDGPFATKPFGGGLTIKPKASIGHTDGRRNGDESPTTNDFRFVFGFLSPSQPPQICVRCSLIFSLLSMNPGASPHSPKNLACGVGFAMLTSRSSFRICLRRVTISGESSDFLDWMTASSRWATSSSWAARPSGPGIGPD